MASHLSLPAASRCHRGAKLRTTLPQCATHVTFVQLWHVDDLSRMCNVHLCVRVCACACVFVRLACSVCRHMRQGHAPAGRRTVSCLGLVHVCSVCACVCVRVCVCVHPQVSALISEFWDQCSSWMVTVDEALPPMPAIIVPKRLTTQLTILALPVVLDDAVLQTLLDCAPALSEVRAEISACREHCVLWCVW